MPGTKRRKSAKKKSHGKKPKATAASLEESSPYGFFDNHKDFPNDIKGPGGKMIRIEYDGFFSSDNEGDYPVGAPNYDLVEANSYGRFYIRLYPPSGAEMWWLYSWHRVPNFYPKPGEEPPSSPVKDLDVDLVRYLPDCNAFDYLDAMTEDDYNYDLPDFTGLKLRH
jgi:hypothetical protein